MGKGEIARNKQFLPFPQCFLPIWRTFSHFHQIRNYHNSFENNVGKGEIARNKQFLPFPQRFLPIWRTFSHFHQIRNYHLQTISVWKSLKLVVWERVKGFAGKMKYVSKRIEKT